MSSASSVRIELGGTASVYCIHDRKKRVVVTETQVAAIGRSIGVRYDSRIHRLFRCACCENLFFDIDDEPRYCHGCRPTRQVHPLGGPLSTPTGGETTG